MPVRPVLRYPDPLLKRAMQPCASIDEAVRNAVADLIDTMRAHPRCVGLAAPQIGVEARIVVVDTSGHPKAGNADQGLLVLVNPVIAASEGHETAREGCLSLPEITVDVGRAVHIRVHSLDIEGRERSFRTQGFEARAIQHEIDHLDGILILDRAASPSEVFARRSKPGS